uniref:DUF7636 domain-containing protein n=1 Tax=Panagrolaimus davidi TaxID=227884 RepID=A0A914R0I2_9BILA
MILSYPPFVISIPDYWSGDFSLNYDILKDASGCVDVAVRLRKNKGRFHYFTVACEGNLKSCLTLERLLTPYLKYDQSISFSQMKQRKTKVMQNLLEKLFGFIPPSEPNESLHHSNSAPGRFITRKRDQFHCEAPRFGFMSHRKE